MNGKIKDLIRVILFVVVIILLLCSWDIYEMTIIPRRTIILILIITGLISTIIIENFSFLKSNKTNDNSIYFVKFVYNSIFWGIISTSILLLSNYYFSEKRISESKHAIIEWSVKYSSKFHKSYSSAQIEYNEIEKKIHFSEKHLHKNEYYNFIKLNTKKGIIWDIIVESEFEK